VADKIIKNELVSDLISLLDDDIISPCDLSHVCLFVAAFIAIKRGQSREALMQGLRERHIHLEKMLANVLTDEKGMHYYVVPDKINE
tara:strand:- start:1161 stop:1421 length:261 start_codon:yes stop_codon:yes gene_type:complete